MMPPLNNIIFTPVNFGGISASTASVSSASTASPPSVSSASAVSTASASSASAGSMASAVSTAWASRALTVSAWEASTASEVSTASDSVASPSAASVSPWAALASTVSASIASVSTASVSTAFPALSSRAMSAASAGTLLASASLDYRRWAVSARSAVCPVSAVGGVRRLRREGFRRFQWRQGHVRAGTAGTSATAGRTPTPRKPAGRHEKCEDIPNGKAVRGIAAARAGHTSAPH